MSVRDLKKTIITEITELTSRKEWQTVIKKKQRLLELTPSRLKRYALQIEIGDLYHEQLKDIDMAVSTYRKALALRNNSRIAMAKLLEIALNRQEFANAIVLLKNLATVERRVDKQVHCLFTIAALYRDELDDRKRALRYFNKALDLDPFHPKSVKAVEDLLRENKDWKTLEYNYRKMIKRMLKEHTAPSSHLVDFFIKLSEVYLDRLNSPGKACATIETALRMQPGDEKLIRIRNRSRTLMTAPSPTMVLKSEKTITPDDSTAILDTNKWFFFRDGGQHGPFTVDAILALYGVGEIDDATYIWTQSMEEWRELKAVYRLYRLCRQAVDSDSSIG